MCQVTCSLPSIKKESERILFKVIEWLQKEFKEWVMSAKRDETTDYENCSDVHRKQKIK